MHSKGGGEFNGRWKGSVNLLWRSNTDIEVLVKKCFLPPYNPIKLHNLPRLNKFLARIRQDFHNLEGPIGL